MFVAVEHGLHLGGDVPLAVARARGRRGGRAGGGRLVRSRSRRPRSRWRSPAGPGGAATRRRGGEQPQRGRLDHAARGEVVGQRRTGRRARRLSPGLRHHLEVGVGAVVVRRAALVDPGVGVGRQRARRRSHAGGGVSTVQVYDAGVGIDVAGEVDGPHREGVGAERQVRSSSTGEVRTRRTPRRRASTRTSAPGCRRERERGRRARRRRRWRRADRRSPAGSVSTHRPAVRWPAWDRRCRPGRRRGPGGCGRRPSGR